MLGADVAKAGQAVKELARISRLAKFKKYGKIRGETNDKKELLSFYPEPASYENYIPENWSGRYEKFLSESSDKYKYWIVNVIDYFNEKE